jgi:hypothetical protein
MLLGNTNQGVAQVKTKKAVGSFVLLGQAYNYEFNKLSSNNFSFSINSLADASKLNTDSATNADTTLNTNTAAEAKEDTRGTTEPAVSGDAPKPTTGVEIFDEFTRDVFTTAFLHQLSSKYSLKTEIQSTGKLSEKDKTEATAKIETMKKKSLEIFFAIQAKLDFLDDEPVTAHMILKKTTVNSILLSNSSNYYDAPLSYPVIRHKVKSVDVETEDGTIKNIIVWIEVPGNPLASIEFKNTQPISISGKHDAEKLANIKLYSFNCNGIRGLHRYLLFSDILEFNIILENDKEDYSPSNRTFTLTPQSSIVELKKEKRSQILSLSAFSDFVGLDQEQPNGLLQIEAKRKININTIYKPISVFWNFLRSDKKKEDENDISKYDLGEYTFRKLNISPKEKREEKEKKKENKKEAKAAKDSSTYQVFLKRAWLVNSGKKGNDTLLFAERFSAERYVREHAGANIVKDGAKYLVKTKQRVAFTDSVAVENFVKNNPENFIKTINGNFEVTIEQRTNAAMTFADKTGAEAYIKKYPANQVNKVTGVWAVTSGDKSDKIIWFKSSKNAAAYVAQNKGSKVNNVAWFVNTYKTEVFTDTAMAINYINRNPENVISFARNIPYDVIKIPNEKYKSGYYTFVPSIEPKLLFSKLDGNNKFLVLDDASSISRDINPLKQFQYQLASFGITTGVFKISYPQSKITWNVLDVGTFWYRTRVQRVQDTATNKSTPVNNGFMSFASQLSFKPDSRWGANLGIAYIIQKAFNSEYKFEKNNGLSQFNFDAFIKTNDESKMFFRFRWVFDGHTFNNNFTQIQLGYSMNIFTSSGSSK